MVMSFLHSVTVSLTFMNIIDTCFWLLVLVLMSCERVDLILLITKIELHVHGLGYECEE